jgi:threonine/homoserine/homoserine lactone efflux protein
MSQYYKTFKTIFLISFLGTLSPGIMTMGVLQAVMVGGQYAALQFSLGAVMIEMLFIGLMIYATSWFYTRQHIFRYFEWTSFGILLVITTSGFLKLIYGTTTTESILPIHEPWLLSGIILRLITPTFIPFWLGWHLTLMSTKIATPSPTSRNVSAFAAGLGTFSVHCLYLLLFYQASSYIPILQMAGSWLILIVLLVSLLWMGRRLRLRVVQA